MYSGVLKQNIFGGVYWDFGNQIESSVDDYDKKKKLLSGVRYENIKFIKEGESIKVLMDLVNPSDKEIDDMASVSYVFTNNDKLVGLKDGNLFIKLKPNERLPATDEIRGEVKDGFDKVSIIFKY